MRYSYKALDINGNEINGELEAEKTEDVGVWLSDRNYIVLNIAAAPIKNLIASPKRYLSISNKDMNFFLIQLSNLISAGCPLLMSLNALQKQASNYSLKILLKEVKESIESGKSFSEALKAHKEIFPSLFITMIEVGEVGGLLAEVLERYSYIYNTTFKLTKKIIQAMIYPLFLLFSSIIVVTCLLIFVFPKFVASVQSKGNELPGITMFVLNVSNFITEYYWVIIILLIASYLIFNAINATNKGRRIITQLFTNTPMIGDVLKQVQISLFARTLGVLLRCGVPILTSLQAVEKALSNVLYKEALTDIRESVSRGESLTQGIGKHRDLFPENIILMTDVGERSGNMGEMLEKAGNIYEKDLEIVLETAVSFIQPALVAFIAIFIVIIAFAMYLPIFDIVKVVG